MHDYISQIENLECKQFVLFLDQKNFHTSSKMSKKNAKYKCDVMETKCDMTEP